MDQDVACSANRHQLPHSPRVQQAKDAQHDDGNRHLDDPKDQGKSARQVQSDCGKKNKTAMVDRMVRGRGPVARSTENDLFSPTTEPGAVVQDLAPHT